MNCPFNNMQIPQHLQHYAHPTLIVVGDFEHVKIYLAHEDTIEEMESLNAPEPKQPDTEGSVNVGGDRWMSPSTDVDDGTRRGQFAVSVSEYLTEALRGGDADRVFVVMPTEECRRILEELPNDLKDQVTKTLEEDLANELLVEVLERLAQA